MKCATVVSLPGVSQDIAGYKIAHQPSTYVLETPGVLVPSIPDIETELKLALAERAQSSEMMEVLCNCQKAPYSLTGCEDLMQPVDRLVPQIICLEFAKDSVRLVKRCHKFDCKVISSFHEEEGDRSSESRISVANPPLFQENPKAGTRNI
ncbi:uncharacterized protein LOC142610541 isoform X3 [Castanea sativa]